MNYSEMSMADLRVAAKEARINSFGMKKIDLIEALKRHSAASDAAVEEQPQRTEQRPTSREQRGRRRRAPLGMMQQRLTYSQRPGYVRRWFNDKDNRIHLAQEAGYEFVEEEQDGRAVKVSQRVGTHEGGSPMVAYLMEIRQEFYDEDQAYKQAQVDKIDEAIMRRIDPENTEAEDRGKFYTPSEGRSMRSETG